MVDVVLVAVVAVVVVVGFVIYIDDTRVKEKKYKIAVWCVGGRLCESIKLPRRILSTLFVFVCLYVVLGMFLCGCWMNGVAFQLFFVLRCEVIDDLLCGQ